MAAIRSARYSPRTLRHDAETIRPMHRVVAESDAFDSYRMVHGNFTGAA